MDWQKKGGLLSVQVCLSVHWNLTCIRCASVVVNCKWLCWQGLIYNLDSILWNILTKMCVCVCERYFPCLKTCLVTTDSQPALYIAQCFYLILSENVQGASCCISFKIFYFGNTLFTWKPLVPPCLLLHFQI